MSFSHLQNCEGKICAAIALIVRASCKIFPHACRVASKIATKDGGRAYSAIYNVMNEHMQIIAAYFVETKSLKELEDAFAKLFSRYDPSQVRAKLLNIGI